MTYTRLRSFMLMLALVAGLATTVNATYVVAKQNLTLTGLGSAPSCPAGWSEIVAQTSAGTFAPLTSIATTAPTLVSSITTTAPTLASSPTFTSATYASGGTTSPAFSYTTSPNNQLITDGSGLSVSGSASWVTAISTTSQNRLTALTTTAPTLASGGTTTTPTLASTGSATTYTYYYRVCEK